MKKFLEQYGLWILGAMIVIILIAIVGVIVGSGGKNTENTVDDFGDTANQVIEEKKEFNPIIKLEQTETTGKFSVNVSTNSTEDAMSLEYRVKDLNGNWSDYAKVDGELSTGNKEHVGDFAVKIENGNQIQIRIYLTADPKDKYASEILTYTGKTSTRETSIISPYSTLTLETGVYILNDVLNAPEAKIAEDFSYIASYGTEAESYKKMMIYPDGLRYRTNSDKDVAAYDFTKSKWKDEEKIKVIVVSSDQTVSKEFKDWFMENTTSSNDYSVLYYSANGGTISNSMRIMKHDELYGSLPVPTKTGYVFDAWYTSRTGGEKVGALTRMDNKNATIFAQYKPAPIKLADAKKSFYYGTTQSFTFGATNGTGEYIYTKVSETTANGGKSEKFTLVGNKITMAKDTELGTYVIKVQAEDKETHEVVTATYEVKVNKGLVGLPSLSNTSPVWTGGDLSPFISYSKELCNMDGSTTAKNVGKYTITFSIKDTNRYTWANGKSEPISLEWGIVKANSEYTAPKAKVLIYDGKSHELIEPGYTDTGTMMYRIAGEQSFTTEIPTATDMGTYKVQYYVVGDKSHNNSEVKTIEVGIGKATVQIPSNGLARVFTGETLSHNIEVPELATIVSSKSNLKSSNVGTYKVTLSVNSNCVWSDGTTSDKEFTWVILPANFKEANVNVAGAPFTYNGAEIKPTVSVVWESRYLTSLVDYEISYSNNVEAGKGKIVLTGKGNFYGTQEIDFTINSALIKYNVNSQACTYTGTEQDCGAKITVSRPSTGYTIKYGTAEGEYNSTFMPKFTDAGIYPVYFEIEAPNYEKVKGQFEITINKKVASFEIAPKAKKSLVYNGEFQELIEAGFTRDGVVKYIFNDVENEMIPVASKAGTYKISYYIEGSENFEPSVMQEIKVTISPIMVTKPYINDSSKTFTGETLTPTIVNYNSDVMIQTGLASGIDAGDYEIRWELKDTENYKWSDGTNSDAVVIWSITKARPVLTAPTSVNIAYDGDEHMLAIAGDSSHGTIYYRLENTEYSTEIPTASEKGTYKVYYKLVGDKNHNDTKESAIESKIY